MIIALSIIGYIVVGAVVAKLCWYLILKWNKKDGVSTDDLDAVMAGIFAVFWPLTLGVFLPIAALVWLVVKFVTTPLKDMKPKWMHK